MLLWLAWCRVSLQYVRGGREHRRSNLSTGLNGSGNVITTSGVSDANWTVNQSGGGTAAAQTVFPGSPDWGPPGGGETGWVANDNNSDWIARDASTPYQSQGIATYSFYRTFDLTGYDLSTVIISVNSGRQIAGVMRRPLTDIKSTLYHRYLTAMARPPTGRNSIPFPWQTRLSLTRG